MMGHLSKQDKEHIRKGAWCKDSRIPEQLQKHYRIQIRYGSNAWMDRYGDLNKAQADIHWQGQSAHNGWKARLLHRGKVIAEKELI